MRALTVRLVAGRAFGSVDTGVDNIDFEAVSETPGMWRVTVCDEMDRLVSETEGSGRFRFGFREGRGQLWVFAG
jgi:hypothetical protein